MNARIEPNLIHIYQWLSSSALFRSNPVSSKRGVETNVWNRYRNVYFTAAGSSSRHQNGRRDDFGFNQSDAVNESQRRRRVKPT